MKLVVIGGVAAGLSAAARARRVDRGIDVVVLEKGSTISQGLCGIPYYVEGQVRSLDELVAYSPERFARERNIEVRTGATVVRIEHPRRQVVLAGGETVRYDRLVIATGARPVRADIDGCDQEHVFSLGTLDDAARLRAFLEARRPRRGLVVGAGYIGLEAAEALRAHGVRVVLADRGKFVFNRPDGELTKIVAAHLARCGVDLRLGETVSRLGPEWDVVVMATGMRPNAELAAEAGLRLGARGAIAVDERMETSQPGIYAAGDCASTEHIVLRKPVWVPLGSTANKMGRVAGANAAGKRERFPGVVGTSIVRVCGLAVAATGVCPVDAREAGMDPVSARIEARDRAGYFRSRPTTVELTADRRNGRLIGATVVGEHEVAGRINVVATAVTRGMTVDDFAQLDLAYAPPYAPVWDPLLIAAQQLLHQL